MRLFGKGRKIVVSGLWLVDSGGGSIAVNYPLITTRCFLVFQQPHRPRSHNYSTYKKDKAVGAVAQHFARGIALGDAEYRGGAGGEYDSGGEVREFDGHCFLPIAMW